MNRAQSLELAAAIIARDVPDLRTLILLLEDGGQRRLAAALGMRAGDKPAEVGGSPRPDARLWAEAAERQIGGGPR